MPWLPFALRIAPLVIGAVQTVERIITGRKKGAEKKAAVIDLVATILAVTEAGIGKDLLNDTAVKDAVSKLIDAAVAVENVVAQRRALR